MLKERATLLRRFMVFADLLLIVGAFYLAYLVRNQDDALQPIGEYRWLLVLLIGVWGGFLYISGMYASFRLKKVSDILFIIYQSAYLSFFVFAGLCYLLKVEHISRLFVLLMFVMGILLITAEKLVLIHLFRYLRRKGLNYRNILIVGTNKRALSFVKVFTQNRDFGMNISGLVDIDEEKVGSVVNGCEVLGTLNDIPRIIKEQAVDQVLFVVPRAWLDKLEEPLQYLETVGIKADIALDYFNMKLARAKQTDLFGVPILSFETAPTRILPIMFKRLIDSILSGVALIVLFPLFAIVAVVIKLTSEGPVFFVQERASLNGRKFSLFKFRTMALDAEERLEELKAKNEMQGPAFKLKNDPRVTKVGGFLRKFSIDELPQLYNVFKGDMSLVGPRPPIPHEVAEYDDWQRRRLSMRPGITCLWQVGGRNKITDFNEWARLDLQYIDNWSLWLDFKILLKTVPVVLIGSGAK